MKSIRNVILVAGLALSLTVGTSASPGGCGGSEPKPTETTTPVTQEPAAPTTQPTQPTVTDATKADQPPAMKPPDTPTGASVEPTVVAKKATLTLNVRNASLEPLPGAPPRTILSGDTEGTSMDSEEIPNLPGLFFESPIRPQSTSAQIVGQSTASQLKALKVYLLRVAICNEQGFSLGPSGTGGNLVEPESNCFFLYKAPEPGATAAASNTYTVDLAKADKENFVDLMNAKDLATRLQNIPVELNSGPPPGTSTGGTATAAKSYVYGLFDVVPYVKVSGEITLNDGRTLVTKDGPVTLQNNGGGTPWTVIKPDSLEGSAGSSQEVVVSSYLGGIFKFQSPFTISQADIESQSAFTLDLVFNPDGLLQGYRNPPFSAAQFLDNGGNSMFVSTFRVGPVPRRGSANVIRESYLFRLPIYNARLELYSVKDDPTKTIYAVDLRVLATKATDRAVADTAIYFLVTGADGKLEFQNTLRTSIISGFSRLTTEGQSGKVKVICSDKTPSGEGTGWNLMGVGSEVAPGCASPSSTIDADYSLVALKEVN